MIYKAYIVWKWVEALFYSLSLMKIDVDKIPARTGRHVRAGLFTFYPRLTYSGRD